jgi:hypothetical protein
MVGSEHWLTPKPPLQRLRRDYDSPRAELTPLRDGDRQNSKTPQRVVSGAAPPAPPAGKESEMEKDGYHSGSEEGEIEED